MCDNRYYIYMNDFVLSQYLLTVRSCIMNTVNKTQAKTDADTCRLYACTVLQYLKLTRIE